MKRKKDALKNSKDARSATRTKIDKQLLNSYQYQIDDYEQKKAIIEYDMLQRPTNLKKTQNHLNKHKVIMQQIQPNSKFQSDIQMIEGKEKQSPSDALILPSIDKKN